MKIKSNFSEEEFENKVTSDNVEHPSHYTQGSIECIDAMVAAYGTEAVKSFCKCNAFKYLWRFNYKNKGEDLDKAVWYINKYKSLMSSTPITSESKNINSKPLVEREGKKIVNFDIAASEILKAAEIIKANPNMNNTIMLNKIYTGIGTVVEMDFTFKGDAGIYREDITDVNLW